MSAKIYRFPKPFRRQATPVVPVFFVNRPHTWVHCGGFGSLLSATIPIAFLYLSGAITVARHDGLYAALLAGVWGFYFLHDRLLRIRVLGPLLIGVGRLLLFAAVAGFFGGIYWLIFSRS
jgi:hypothetical protein